MAPATISGSGAKPPQERAVLLRGNSFARRWLQVADRGRGSYEQDHVHAVSHEQDSAPGASQLPRLSRDQEQGSHQARMSRGASSASLP